MSIVDDANACMREAADEILRLRAANAHLLAEMEEITSFLANQPRTQITDFIERVASAAIARAKGETFNTNQARNGVAP